MEIKLDDSTMERKVLKDTEMGFFHKEENFIPNFQSIVAIDTGNQLLILTHIVMIRCTTNTITIQLLEMFSN